MNYKRIAQILIWLGFAVILIFSIIISIQEFIPDSSIDLNKIGDLGSFFEGLVGSFWSLAGILLIFVALQEQQKQNEITQESLNVQIKELEYSQKNHLKQIDNFIIQRFENSFIKLLETFLNLEQKIVDSIDSNLFGKRYFKHLVRLLKKEIKGEFREAYIDYFYSIPYEYDNVDINSLSKSQLIKFYLEVTQHFGLGKIVGISSLNKKKNFSSITDNINRFSKIINRILTFIVESEIDKITKNESIKTLHSLISKEQIILIYYLDSPKWSNNMSTGIISENVSIRNSNIFTKSRDIGLFGNLSFFDLLESKIYQKLVDEESLNSVKSFDNDIKSYFFKGKDIDSTSGIFLKPHNTMLSVIKSGDTEPIEGLILKSLSGYDDIDLGKITIDKNVFIKKEKTNDTLTIEIQVIDNFTDNSILAFKSLLIDIMNFYWQTQYSQNVLSKNEDEKIIYCDIDIKEEKLSDTYTVTYLENEEYIDKTKTEKYRLFNIKIEM
jgi:hypothetical protein